MNLVALLLASAGLAVPMMFYSVSLPALMREEGLPLTFIGLTGLVYLPYAFAFLWAPIVDRSSVSASGIGRRRLWVATMLVVMALVAAASALAPPARGLAAGVAGAFFIPLFGATARTAMLGFAVENLKPSQRPWGGAILPAGGALGALIGASVLIFLYERAGWAGTMLALAAILLVPLVSLLTVREASTPPTRGALSPSLRRFFERSTSRSVLMFLLPLAVGFGLSFGMMQPRLVDLGFTLDQIGLINGVFTCIALLTGGPIAAWLIGRFGLAAIIPLGVTVNSAILMYVALASYWDLPAFHAAAALVLFYLGFSFVGVMTNTLFMNQSRKDQAGTDFTLFICLYWFLSMIGIGLSGLIADSLGYAVTFGIGASLVLCSLLFVRGLPIGFETAEVSNS